MTRVIHIALLWLIVSPALAEPMGQETLMAHYRAPVDACIASADPGDALAPCNGMLADACMEQEEGGYSTQGMAICMQAEARFWDEWLNTEYRRLVAILRAADEAEAAIAPEYAVREERLRAAQRAWIAFRDAECALEYAQWGMGSMRLLSGASCLSTMTFQRVTDLIRLRENHE